MENSLQRSPKISKLTCGVCSNVGGEDGDRLSNLPEPIVHHIFSFLETIDVVRASAVSQKWRYLWLSIPYLNFNIHNIWSNPLERWSLQTTNEKFKDFVNWVLLFQNGSVSIHRFRLSCLNRVDDYTLYRWIAVVARRNVQVLDLHIISDEPIKLPRSLVTCESLVSLKLDFGNREHQGVLNLPTCAGFSRLKSLDLQHVEDEYYDDWEIPDKVILCLTCHLKTVELIDFSGNENELELVRFLLKNGHVLQKLRVSWLKGVENRREIISAIMKFTISSSGVALKFLEPKPFLDFFNTF